MASTPMVQGQAGSELPDAAGSPHKGRVRPQGKNILILTNPSDGTADRVSVALRDRNAWVSRLDTADFPLRCSVNVSYGANVSNRRERRGRNLITRDSGPCVDLDAIDSIWYRRPGPFQVNPVMSAHARRFAAAEAEMAISGMLRNVNAFWMNHPSAIGETRYKLVQLNRAERLKLRIPDTIVTNDPDAAYDFAAAHPEGIIVKTIASPNVLPEDGDHAEPGIIMTSEVKDRSRDAFAAVQHTACLFQELIPKKYDIRVTLVGRKLFPVAIDSQSNQNSVIDWRSVGPALSHEVTDLPEEIESKLLELAHSFNLKYAAIDMVRSVSGEYVFLEINPNGQWEWIEAQTSLPIADTIAATLISQGS